MFTHRFAFHPLGGQRAGGDGGAAAKRFKFGIHNLSLAVNLNLKRMGFFLKNIVHTAKSKPTVFNIRKINANYHLMCSFLLKATVFLIIIITNRLTAALYS